MRLFLGILIAVLVNFGLFLLMQKMTEPKTVERQLIEEIQLLDFVRAPEQESNEPETKKRELPKKPPPPDQPPPPPDTPKPMVEKPTPPTPDIQMPQINVPMNIAGEPYLGEFTPTPKPTPAPAPTPAPVNNAPIVDNEVMPVVRVPPQYPRSAMRRGIEGVVTVTFIITKDGTVRDARVVNSNPQSVFDREALKAVSKWKFKPRLIDGQPVERQATQQIEFKLSR